MNIYLQNGSLEDRLANQSLPRHLTRFRSNSLQRGLPTPIVAVTAPPFFLFSCWYTRSLCHFFGCFIFHFLRILTFPFSKFFRPSLSLFFSFPNLGLLPLEVFLLGYEQLLGSWIPFTNSMESTLFQPCSGFASGFLIHPLEEIAPAFGTFEVWSPWILL